MNRYDFMLDSLKTRFNSAGTDIKKARAAIEVAGFLIYRSTGETPEAWLSKAATFEKSSKDPVSTGFSYIFRSYRLASLKKDEKYSLLDSAEKILPDNMTDGRNLIMYIRVCYDLAYGMDQNTETDLLILKKNLEKQNASGFIWANFYYQQKAQLAWNQKNYSQAVHYFLQAKKVLESDKYFKTVSFPVRFGIGIYENPAAFYARTCNNIGVSYARLDSFTKAIKYYKKGIETFQVDADVAGAAWTYQLIGECYLKIGLPAVAEQWYFKAISEFEKIPRIASDDYIKKDFFDCLFSLGNIELQLHHYDRWISVLDSASIYINNFGAKTRNYYNASLAIELQKAIALFNIGKSEDAAEVLINAKNTFENSGKDDKEAADVKNLSLANISLFTMLKAWQAYNNNNYINYASLRDKALATLDLIYDWSDKIFIYNQVAMYMINAGDNVHVIQYHIRYFQKLDSKSEMVEKKNLAGELSDAFAHMKMYDSAYAYTKIYSALSDSIHVLQNMYAMTDLSEKYQSEAEKTTLERQNEALERQRMQNIILFISGFFILSLIIAILFLNRQRLTSQNKFEKSEKEKLKLELSQQQKELSDTALEIVRSNNAYEGLMQDIEHIGKTVRGDNRRQLKQLIISQKMHNQEDRWRLFNIQFEKMNSGFYKALLEIEPTLTESEKKICALMALGLLNKEISAVTFQSLKSIYTYKNRLRKKFSTTSDIELAERLSKLLSS